MRVATSTKLLEKFTKHPAPVVETDWERFFFSLDIFSSSNITDVRTSCRWESGQNTTFVGPGHPCVVGDWLVYHAWLFDHVAADQVVHFNCFRSWQHSKNRKFPEDNFWSIGSCGHPTGQTPSGQGWPVEDLRILNNLHRGSFQLLLSCRTVPIVYTYSYVHLSHKYDGVQWLFIYFIPENNLIYFLIGS